VLKLVAAFRDKSHLTDVSTGRRLFPLQVIAIPIDRRLPQCLFVGAELAQLLAGECGDGAPNRLYLVPPSGSPCAGGSAPGCCSAVQRARYMTPETIAPLSDDPIVSLPAVAA
jgi:hypothetical protein